jgi:endonuclease YncB( thermonuclease family)
VRHLLVALLCWTVLGTPTRTIDGDTFIVDLRVWLGLTARETVRILGVNTPERHGATKAAGDEARTFTQAWLDGEIRLEVCQRDAFGRLLATVTRVRDGENLGDVLLRTGRAVPYTR